MHESHSDVGRGDSEQRASRAHCHHRVVVARARVVLHEVCAAVRWTSVDPDDRLELQGRLHRELLLRVCFNTL